jgi:aldose 1-epimerase
MEMMMPPRGTVTALLLASVVMVVFFCQGSEAKSKMQEQPFGKTEDGQAVDLYTLTNDKGMEVSITNFGATVVSIKVPDRNGKMADVVLGYDDLKGYETGTAFFGGTVGRYANRIAHGQFTLDGKVYHLPKNDGDNTLHGGLKSFNKHLWTAKDVSTSSAQALQLMYLSKDGEEGFPGNLTATVTFTLPAERNELRIDYGATTDKDTVVNLTNHSYFNLDGEGNGTILGAEVMLNAKQFTPIDATLIPTGELRNVQGTPFDFTKLTPIGTRINDDNEQIKFGKGYDHNWVIDRKIPGSLTLAAEAYDPKSGRELQVLTTEPGVQFYTGNMLDGTIHGKGGKIYKRRYAFCLETQHFPDSPNHPNFPSTELKPGEHFHSTTIFRFSVK